MKYTIGKVADFLHISRDMIRYYEKPGLILSEQNEAINYRIYDNMAVFGLLEAIRHKNLNMIIKEIEKMRHGDYEGQIHRIIELQIKIGKKHV